MNNKYFKLEAFKIDDEYELKSLNESIYKQLAINMAKSADIELVKTPLIDLITGYQDSLVLGFKNQQLQQENQQLKQALLDIKEYIETNSYFKDNIVKTMVLGDYSKGILDIVNKVLGSDSND